MTPSKIALAQGAMEKSETKIVPLCKELGVSRQTLYRHISPTGQLRPDAQKVIDAKKGLAH